MGFLRRFDKRDSQATATATPATVATVCGKGAAGRQAQNDETVAGVATVAVATSQKTRNESDSVSRSSNSVDSRADPQWTDHRGRYVDPNHVEHMFHGVVPSHYKRIVTCKQCGPVWIYELVTIADERGVVPECPWCQVREAGKPVPLPPEPKHGYPTYDIGVSHWGTVVVATCGVDKRGKRLASQGLRHGVSVQETHGAKGAPLKNEKFEKGTDEMMQAAIYGRLGGAPKELQTKSGNPMAVASVALNLDRSDGDRTTWVKLIAFGRVAEDLQRHDKGDCLRASGRMQMSHWQDHNGNERESMELVCDSLVSTRTVRPGGRRKASVRSDEDAESVRMPGEHSPQYPAAHGGPLGPVDPDDALPF